MGDRTLSRVPAGVDDDPARRTARDPATPVAITLVRHGQASFGAEEYDALSELGVRQAGVLGAALAASGVPPSRVVCGTMRRHRQTAEACLAAMGLPLRWEEDAGWNEFDHVEVLAALEPRFAAPGALVAESARVDSPNDLFLRVFTAAVERWTSGAHDSDYREPWPAFLSRVDGAFRRLGPEAGGGGALVFTSGGAISVACRRALGLSDAGAILAAWRLVNAGITRIEVGADGARLVGFNESGHLDGPPPGLRTLL